MSLRTRPRPKFWPGGHNITEFYMIADSQPVKIVTPHVHKTTVKLPRVSEVITGFSFLAMYLVIPASRQLK